MRFLVGYATRAFPAQIDCSSTVVKVVSRDETVNVPIAGLSNLVNVASLPLPEVALASTSKKASEYALYLRSVNDPFPRLTGCSSKSTTNTPQPTYLKTLPPLPVCNIISVQPARHEAARPSSTSTAADEKLLF